MRSNDGIRPLLEHPGIILVSGYARLPDTVASHSQYERLGVVLAVDVSDGRIVAADTTLLTDLAKEFFRALVEGLSVTEDITEIVERVQHRYAGQSGGALATALRRCLETFHQRRETEHPPGAAGAGTAAHRTQRERGPERP
ncbi:hypothetical protein GCM10027570_18850 [Streptomonospora sediminis]